MTEQTPHTNDNNVTDIYPGVDLRLDTLSNRVEDVIRDWIKTNRVSQAAAIGVLEMIKNKIARGDF